MRLRRRPEERVPLGVAAAAALAGAALPGRNAAGQEGTRRSVDTQRHVGRPRPGCAPRRAGTPLPPEGKGVGRDRRGELGLCLGHEPGCRLSSPPGSLGGQGIRPFVFCERLLLLKLTPLLPPG